MLSLSNLPTELLLSILKRTSSRQDLRNMGLTCKKFHEVANDLMYASISLDWSPRPETSSYAVTFLLRSLMENPKLGGLIKDLYLHGRDFRGFIKWNTLTPPVCVDALDLNMVSSTIHGFQVPHAQEWEEEARRGKMDAIVTLLLSFLPNLTRLRVLSNFAKETRILGLTLMHDIKAASINNGVLPMRHSLEDVTVSRFRLGNGKVKEDNTAETLLWFYLPKIRLLNLSIDNPKSFTWPLEHSPCPSQLRSLRLSLIREPHAQQVFAVCNGLKQLSWTLEHNAEFKAISKPNFDLNGVTDALGPLRESLEDLTLKASIEMGPSDIEYPHVDVRGSLAIADFPAVRKFTLSWSLAMGIQPNCQRRLSTSIPRNVQEITITDDLEQTEDFEWDEFSMLGPIDRFLSSHKEHTPFLEQFNLVVEGIDANWSDRMRKEIQYLCAGVGLKCKILQLPDDGLPFESPPPGWVWRAPESWDADMLG